MARPTLKRRPRKSGIKLSLSPEILKYMDKALAGEVSKSSLVEGLLYEWKKKQEEKV